ncbi:MAG: SPFH domain-containing protein [Thermoplasmata archaeon]|nr:SPFH domain-containing protein [Thermoplasmata archaeon]
MGFFSRDYTGKKVGDLEGADARNTYFWVDEYKGKNLLWRLPHNVRWNDNIVVREDEYAVFFRDGKALYVFDRPGRYALTTQNVPVLATLAKKLIGVQQIGEIYYIQGRELRDRFGTSEPLTFRDPDFGIVRIRAFGQFAYKVKDPLLFITQFVGTEGMASSKEIVSWLKDQIVMVLNDTLGELKLKKNMSVLDFPAYLTEMEDMVLARLREETARYGLEVTKFSGLNLNLPEEVQEAVDKRTSMAALGVNYLQYQTGKAIEDIGAGAAKGGDTSGMAGLGAGLGAGMSMAGMMAQGMQPLSGGGPPPVATKRCPKCGREVPGEAKFCMYCGYRFDTESGKKCWKCGRDMPLDAVFCPFCGAPQKRTCPSCGREVPPESAFCPYCGQKMI